MIQEIKKWDFENFNAFHFDWALFLCPFFIMPSAAILTDC